MEKTPNRLREEIAQMASERLAESGTDAIFNDSTAEYFVTEEYKDNGLLSEDGIEVRPGHVHEDFLRWRNN